MGHDSYFGLSVRSLTLGYGGWSVRALRQLVGLQAWHGWRGETTRNEVVEGHQLTGPSLFPPAGSSVAKPNLREEPRQEFAFNYLRKASSSGFYTHALYYMCTYAIKRPF